MPSMGGEKGLARNQDSLGKYTPIPLAAQGLPNSSLCYQESSWLVHKGGKSCCYLGTFHCPLGRAVRALCTAGETISGLSPEFPAGTA